MFFLEKIKSLFTRNPAPVEEEEDFSRISFELRGTTNILVGCAWPKPSSEEEAKQIIMSYANLLYMANSGRLLAATQQAIAAFNPEDEIHKQMALAILAHFNVLLKENGFSSIDNDSPVVSPRDCFAVRGGNND